MKNKSGTWLGFLAGAAVGVGIYAFLTSKEGKTWLNRMKQKAKDFNTDLEELLKKQEPVKEEETDEEYRTQND